MNIEDFIPQGEQKMRIVQELVPGKQVTLAHVIASPDPIIYRKLGLDPKLDYNRAALGILSRDFRHRSGYRHEESQH